MPALVLIGAQWGDEGKGKDGYVSLEVDPTLAYEREATFEQAMRLHEEVERPNLFVKIPATLPGLGAIEDCIAKGKSINVTLIFSLDRYAAVAEAYLRGLERLVASGGDPGTVLSVASFFVSRVDTEADRRLDAIGSRVYHLGALGAEPVTYGEGLTDRVRALAPDGVDVVADFVGGVVDVTTAVLREAGRHASVADPAVLEVGGQWAGPTQHRLHLQEQRHVCPACRATRCWARSPPAPPAAGIRPQCR